jgi:hypothetical protein
VLRCHELLAQLLDNALTIGNACSAPLIRLDHIERQTVVGRIIEDALEEKAIYCTGGAQADDQLEHDDTKREGFSLKSASAGSDRNTLSPGIGRGSLVMRIA